MNFLHAMLVNASEEDSSKLHANREIESNSLKRTYKKGNFLSRRPPKLIILSMKSASLFSKESRF